MVAEVSSTPKAFASLDDLYSWLLDQFRGILRNGGGVFFNEEDAQNILTAYETLTREEGQV